MIKGKDVINLTIPLNARVITDSERTLNKENINQDNQDKTDNTSQDSPESTSQDSQGKTDNTNPEKRDRTVSIKIRKEGIEIHKQSLSIKRILICLSGISRMSQPLDLQAGISNNPDNLPHNHQEASRNPNPESSKQNKSLSRSQRQRVMMVQGEEGLFDAVEGRLQLKEERND
jgi:hypothetical protein